MWGGGRWGMLYLQVIKKKKYHEHKGSLVPECGLLLSSDAVSIVFLPKQCLIHRNSCGKTLAKSYLLEWKH